MNLHRFYSQPTRDYYKVAAYVKMSLHMSRTRSESARAETLIRVVRGPHADMQCRTQSYTGYVSQVDTSIDVSRFDGCLR